MTDASLPKCLSRELQKLAFLRGSIRVILVWLLLCMVMIAAVWTITLTRIRNDKAEVERDAQRQAAHLSSTYAGQLSRSIDHIDQITRSVKYYWQATHGALALDDQLRQGLYPESAQLYVTIVDRHGTLLTSTLDKSDTRNSAATDSFQSDKLDPATGLRIVPGSAQRPGPAAIRFTRRLEAPDGAFDGILTVGVEPAYLATSGNESSPGMGEFLSVMDSNRTLLASGTGQQMQRAPAAFQMPPLLAAASGAGRMPGEQFSDHQPHIVAWQRLKDYPLLALVGLSDAQVFSAHRARADENRYFAMLRCLFLLLFAVIAIFLSVRLAWRKRQADEVNAAYQLAIDGAREGFYMVRALYDHHNSLLDFMVADCNERGAALVGFSKDELVGKKFSELYAGAQAQRVLAIFRRAMADGYYEDEFRAAPQSPPHVTWMSRKLVRSGPGLAMTVRDISDSKAHQRTLLNMANMDALTALPNRHWLMNSLPAALCQAKDCDATFALLFIDLDGFKAINDSAGHQAGDALLQAAALRLKSVLRPADQVVRLGGDEFTVLLNSIAGRDEAAQVARRINEEFRQPFEVCGRQNLVGASIGISLFPRDGGDAETLIRHADIAMYAAKAEGKGQFRFYERQTADA